MRESNALFAIAFTALLLGCQGASKLDLTHLSRATWQRPDDVVAAIGVQPGHTVADLGAGEGYFVAYLSDAVGESGKVLAVDVEAEIVDALRVEFQERKNVEAILGQYEDPLLPDGGVDLVLIVNTFHHIDDPEAYFAKLQADLAQGGRVAVLEPNAELTGFFSVFLDEEHTSTSANVQQTMQAAGYRLVESFDILPIQIFELFEPEAAP